MDRSLQKMKDKLRLLERELEGLSKETKFPHPDLSMYPDSFQQVHSFRLFGNDLLAIPANLIIEGDDDEFEIPFNFTDDLETINIFESEFRKEIPTEFIQIGNLHGSTEIVLLNKLKETIHIFHVSDIVDKNWLTYKLEKAVCNLDTFIENIRPQTVCCLMNPKDFSKWDIFEIRNNNEIKSYDTCMKYESYEHAWTEYKKIVIDSMAKGYEIHYAPKKLQMELKK